MPSSNNIFKEVQIYNSDNEKISADNLFSEDKRNELNSLFNSSKRNGMVNVMKVEGMGIFMNLGVNSPKGGKLRNSLSRRVERGGGDVSRSTPINLVGPLGQIYVPRSGRIGPLGSGHRVRDASEFGGSAQKPSSVHRIHLEDTFGQGARSATVGPLGLRPFGSVHMAVSAVSENPLSLGGSQSLGLEAQTDGQTEVEVDKNDRLTDNYVSNSGRSSDCKCSALGSVGSGGLIQS